MSRVVGLPHCSTGGGVTWCKCGVSLALNHFGGLGRGYWVRAVVRDETSEWGGLTLFRQQGLSVSPITMRDGMSVVEDKLEH